MGVWRNETVFGLVRIFDVDRGIKTCCCDKSASKVETVSEPLTNNFWPSSDTGYRGTFNTLLAELLYILYHCVLKGYVVQSADSHFLRLLKSSVGTILWPFLFQCCTSTANLWEEREKTWSHYRFYVHVCSNKRWD